MKTLFLYFLAMVWLVACQSLRDTYSYPAVHHIQQSKRKLSSWDGEIPEKYQEQNTREDFDNNPKDQMADDTYSDNIAEYTVNNTPGNVDDGMADKPQGPDISDLKAEKIKRLNSIFYEKAREVHPCHKDNTKTCDRGIHPDSEHHHVIDDLKRRQGNPTEVKVLVPIFDF